MWVQHGGKKEIKWLSDFEGEKERQLSPLKKGEGGGGTIPAVRQGKEKPARSSQGKKGGGEKRKPSSRRKTETPLPKKEEGTLASPREGGCTPEQKKEIVIEVKEKKLLRLAAPRGGNATEKGNGTGLKRMKNSRFHNSYGRRNQRLLRGERARGRAIARQGKGKESDDFERKGGKNHKNPPRFEGGGREEGAASSFAIGM